MRCIHLSVSLCVFALTRKVMKKKAVFDVMF